MLILINLFPCLMWGKQLLLVGYDLLGGDAAILPKKVKSHFSNKSLFFFKKYSVLIQRTSLSNSAPSLATAWAWARMAELTSGEIFHFSGTPELDGIVLKHKCEQNPPVSSHIMSAAPLFDPCCHGTHDSGFFQDFSSLTRPSCSQTSPLVCIILG